MYTYKQLQDISATKQAIKGKKYTQDNGDVYIGESNGRLKLMENSNNVVVSKTTTNVTQAISANNNNIEDIMLELQNDSLLGFTKFTYDLNGNITQKIVYLDSSLSITKFVVSYSYSGDDLTEINVNRVSDNTSYRKTLTYDINGNVTNKNITQ